jgi:hypothetical protein
MKIYHSIKRAIFPVNVVSRYESVDPHRVDKLTKVFARLCRPCFCSADDACTDRYDIEDFCSRHGGHEESGMTQGP